MAIENTKPVAKKFQISEAICSKSGLKFRWVEETIRGLDYSLFLHVHVLFLGENFLKVERELLHDSDYRKLDKVIAAGLVLYRLNSWKVLDPKPEPRLLNAWVEYMGKELSHNQLRSCYKKVLENFNPKSEENKYARGFKFSLNGIMSEEWQDERGDKSGIRSPLNQLMYLIGKCKERGERGENREDKEQITSEEIEKIRIIKEGDETIERMGEEINVLSKIVGMDKEVLRKKVGSVIGNVYRTINWEGIGKKNNVNKVKKQMRMAREEVESGKLEVMSVDMQEKILVFLEWGLKKGKVNTKNEELVKGYVAYIRKIGEGEDWENEEDMEDMEEMGERFQELDLENRIEIVDSEEETENFAI